MRAKEITGIVYVHINKLNGKKYVGSTIQKTSRRFKKAGRSYSAYKTCPIFFAALQKYTWDNFETIELCSCTTLKDVEFLEGYFMEYYDSVGPNGYNAVRIVNGRVQFTDEVKAKISAAHLGRKTGLPSWNHKDHIQKDGISHKECSCCKELKPLEAFCKDSKAKWDGLSYYCRVCSNAKQKRSREREQKLSPEAIAQSYIDRTAKMAASVKARFDSDPTYKAKISAARSKAIIATNIETGEVLEFVSALEAKAQGYHNVSVGRAIKESKPYKGFTWRFK